MLRLALPAVVLALAASASAQHPLGVDYCAPMVPNSVGAHGALTAFGSNQPAYGDVRLRAGGLPPHALGLFFVGTDADSFPVSGGTLCVGGLVGAVLGPSGPFEAGVNGTFEAQLDIGALPIPGGPIRVVPGDLWHFQAWYRDLTPGAPMSRLTNALAIPFGASSGWAQFPARALASPYFFDRVHIVDVDSDGETDVLGFGFYGWPSFVHFRSVVRGLGRGEFSAPIFGTPVLDFASVSATGDLDGDGLTDLAIGGYFDRIYTGIPGGEFNLVADFDASAYGLAHTVELRDFDADGDDDVFFGHDTWTIVENLGAGVYRLAFEQSAGQGVGGYALADVNGDGLVDVLSCYAAESAIGVSLNLGGWSFSALSRIPGSPATMLAAGDFDGDGLNDLLAAAQGLVFRAGLGGGAFGPERVLAAGPPPAPGLTVVDIESDGDLDVVFGGDRTVVSLVNDGAANFVAQHVVLSAQVAHIDVGDVDRDGALDVLTSASTLLRGDGTGNFIAPTLVYSGGNNSGLAAADFNRDGLIDLVLSERWTPSAHLCYAQGTTGQVYFAPPVDVAIGLGQWEIAAADVDGDGWSDIVAGHEGHGPGQVSICFNDGAGGFASSQLYHGGALQSHVALGDVNGDGRLDIVSAGHAAVSVLLNAGNRTFLSPQSTPLPASWTYVGELDVGDLDGDGVDEIVIMDSGSGELVSFAVSSAGVPLQSASYVIATPPLMGFELVDMNRDGHLDLLCLTRSSSPNNWPRAIVLELAGGLASATERPIRISGAPTTIAATDIDGDGLVDIVSAGSYRTQVSYARGDGTYWRTESFDDFGWFYALADFDSDGQVDIASGIGDTTQGPATCQVLFNQAR